MILPCQKHLFHLDPQVHYLNCAYMSPLLQSVEEAGIRAMLQKRSPNRIAPQDFFTDPERLRGLFARLVNARSGEEVALIPSVSYGMAVIAKNLNAARGQKIVVAEDQFPSNVYPWLTLAKEKGLEVQIVEMPTRQDERGSHWNERLLDAIGNHTALVAIGHVHWANGTVFDLEKIAEKAHRHGGLLVVDGTQSVGALPMDVQKFRPDALICAGYKWLMGPYSTGYAWFSPAFLDGQPLEENWINRLYSEDFTRLVEYQPEYQPGARQNKSGSGHRRGRNFQIAPARHARLDLLSQRQ
jgi:selenocysteine lyase/cysteine desulfurase